MEEGTILGRVLDPLVVAMEAHEDEGEEGGMSGVTATRPIPILQHSASSPSICPATPTHCNRRDIRQRYSHRME